MKTLRKLAGSEHLVTLASCGCRRWTRGKDAVIGHEYICLMHGLATILHVYPLEIPTQKTSVSASTLW